MRPNRGKTRNMIHCALFTALIAVGAFLRVPVPVVPFTLQTFFDALAGLLLGAARRGQRCSTSRSGLWGCRSCEQGGYVFRDFGYLLSSWPARSSRDGSRAARGAVV